MGIKTFLKSLKQKISIAQAAVWLGVLAAWTPIAIEMLTPTRIHGKVISIYPVNKMVGRTQPIHLLKIAISSENNDFFLKDFNIYIKYPATEELQCTNEYFVNVAWRFNENGGSNKWLLINNNDYILTKLLFPKNETVSGYLSFSTPHLLDEQYEYIKLELIDFNNDKKELKLFKSDVDSKKLLFENTIWKDTVINFKDSNLLSSR